MPSPFEQIEAAYLERIIPSTLLALRRTFVANLIEAHPELRPDQARAIEEYFDEHGSLVGLAIKYGDD